MPPLHPIHRIPIPTTTLQKFTTLAPWTTKIFSNPQKYIPIETPTRTILPNKENTFFAETLNSPDTFSEWITFYIPPSQNGNSSEKYPYPEILSLMIYGTALNGHPNTLHGGAISLIFDEILGTVAYLCSGFGREVYTAWLKTDFKKQILTPGVLVGRARVCEEGSTVGSGGRKIFVRGLVGVGVGVGEGDSEEEEKWVCARGEALMIEGRGGGEKL